MRIKTNEFAKELKKRNGIELAVRIADRCAAGTSVDNWNALPNSSIYFPKDRKGSSAAPEKSMKATHNFWIEVASLLRKSQ